MSGPYLGDYAEDSTIDFKWDTSDGSGASITRATNGTVSVYKANGTTQTTVGVTDTEDFDTLTGIHHCRIDTSADAFYASANDYQVVLSGATIDGQTVNAVIASFSIENRVSNVTKISGSATAANNAEIVFDTDFATNYDTTNNYWAALLADDPNHGGSSLLITGDRLSFTSTSGTCAKFTGEGSGRGIEGIGGATSGAGIGAASGGGNGAGFDTRGFGTGPGILSLGGSGGGEGAVIRAAALGTAPALRLDENSGSGNPLADGSGNHVEVALKDDAITSGKYDESTAFPIPGAITVANNCIDANLERIHDDALTASKPFDTV